MPLATHLLLDSEQLGRVGLPLFVVRCLLFVQAAGQPSGAVFQVLLQLFHRAILSLSYTRVASGTATVTGRTDGGDVHGNRQTNQHPKSDRMARGPS